MSQATSHHPASNSNSTTTPVVLTAKDVNSWGGVYCPHPQAAAAIASNHPRVNVDLATGQGKCPYCGTVYQLPADYVSHGH